MEVIVPRILHWVVYVYTHEETLSSTLSGVIVQNEV